jgi:hypothetical protein
MRIVVTINKKMAGPLLLIDGVRREETSLETQDQMDILFRVQPEKERAFLRLLDRSDQVVTWNILPEREK